MKLSKNSIMYYNLLGTKNINKANNLIINK